MVVTRLGSGLDALASFDDPRLRALRIDVQLIGDGGATVFRGRRPEIDRLLRCYRLPLVPR